jgi:hypothetical protein
MARPHQPGQVVFRSIVPEDIDWQPFPDFPPARLSSSAVSIQWMRQMEQRASQL